MPLQLLPTIAAVAAMQRVSSWLSSATRRRRRKATRRRRLASAASAICAAAVSAAPHCGDCVSPCSVSRQWFGLGAPGLLIVPSRNYSHIRSASESSGMAPKLWFPPLVTPIPSIQPSSMLLRGVRLFLWLLFELAFLFDVFTKLIQQFDILKSLHILWYIIDCCIWMEKDIIVKQVFQAESISMCGIFSPFWASQFFC